MKKFIIFILVILILFAVSFGGVVYFYYDSLKPVSENDVTVTFEVLPNDTFATIGERLESSGLIKSDLFYKVYVKLNNPTNLQVGPYLLNQNMSVSEIIEVLSSNNTYNPDAISVTFREGLNMRHIALIIEDNTVNTYDEVLNLLEDEAYIDSLINEYWFLTEEIKNDEIYYPLEGYLFPNTYSFSSDDISVEEIFKKMLDQTDVILTEFKTNIENSDYTIHEMLTMASIIELEAATADYRNGVAGVFYNRLEDNWSLGSDVTTYYAIKVDVSERDLYQSELDDVNAYNTRSSSMAGKLPVSAICNPGLDSIEAAINPTISDYYYFVADIDSVTHFTKTYTEHNNKINELKAAGKWYEYN